MEFLSPVGQKVIKATAKEESPTPGYLLVELANHTMTDAKDAELIFKCLMKRAAMNDPMIKYKTFVVIKHLCLKGNPSLKRSFSQSALVIKEALQYKGRPHPLRGDKPNQNVRDAAKAALAALYSQAKQVKTRKMEGFGGGQGRGSGALGSRGGSSSSSSSSGGRSSSGSFGRGDRSPGGSNVASSPGSESGGPRGTVLGPQTSNKYGRGIGSAGSMDPVKKRPEDQIREGIQRAVSGLKKFGQEVDTYAKKAAGDFKQVVGRSGVDGYGFASNRGDSSSSSLTGSTYAAPGSDRTVNQATSDGSFERSIITDLVAPTGMNNVPDMEKLARFLKRCETLSADVVGPILDDKMRRGEFKVKCKTLVTVHAILEQDNLTNFHRYFKENHAVIQELCGDKAAVAKKAQRVLETLESIVLGPGSEPTVDEMGGGDDDGGFDFESGDAGAAAGGGGGAEDDMFADMGGDGDADMYVLMYACVRACAQGKARVFEECDRSWVCYACMHRRFADMEADGGDDMFAGMDGVDDSAGGGGFDFGDSAPAPAVMPAVSETLVFDPIVVLA